MAHAGVEQRANQDAGQATEAAWDNAVLIQWEPECSLRKKHKGHEPGEEEAGGDGRGDLRRARGRGHHVTANRGGEGRSLWIRYVRNQWSSPFGNRRSFGKGATLATWCSDEPRGGQMTRATPPFV